MKLFLSAAVSAFVIAFAAPSLAQSMSAEEFAAQAASSDMFEIRSSELAQDKSQSDEVRAFADQMIADHTAASEKLKAAAATSGVEVPAEMLDKHQSQVSELEGLDGEAFDDAYVEAQVAAHEEALALMQGYAENGDDEALKAHAAATAPVIEGHLGHVRDLAE